MLKCNLGIDLRINNGTPEWSERGADTWSPFKSGGSIVLMVGLLVATKSTTENNKGFKTYDSSKIELGTNSYTVLEDMEVVYMGGGYNILLKVNGNTMCTMPTSNDSYMIPKYRTTLSLVAGDVITFYNNHSAGMAFNALLTEKYEGDSLIRQ